MGINLQIVWYLMCNQENCQLAFQSVDCGGDLSGGFLVQVGRGLVEDQYLWLLQQGAGDCDALLLTA
jgi:hypothetical protein